MSDLQTLRSQRRLIHMYRVATFSLALVTFSVTQSAITVTASAHDHSNHKHPHHKNKDHHPKHHLNHEHMTNVHQTHHSNEAKANIKLSEENQDSTLSPRLIRFDSESTVPHATAPESELEIEANGNVKASKGPSESDNSEEKEEYYTIPPLYQKVTPIKKHSNKESTISDKSDAVDSETDFTGDPVFQIHPSDYHHQHKASTNMNHPITNRNHDSTSSESPSTTSSSSNSLSNSLSESFHNPILNDTNTHFGIVAEFDPFYSLLQSHHSIKNNVNGVVDEKPAGLSDDNCTSMRDDDNNTCVDITGKTDSTRQEKNCCCGYMKVGGESKNETAYLLTDPDNYVCYKMDGGLGGHFRTAMANCENKGEEGVKFEDTVGGRGCWCGNNRIREFDVCRNGKEIVNTLDEAINAWFSKLILFWFLLITGILCLGCCCIMMVYGLSAYALFGAVCWCCFPKDGEGGGGSEVVGEGQAAQG